MKWRVTFGSCLLFLMIFVGCGGPKGNSAEAEAVAAILKLKGKIEFDEQNPDHSVVKVYLHSTEVKDEDLAAIEKLAKLQNLFLGKTSIGDAGLEHLKGAGGLRTLSLNGTQVTDAGLKSLAGLKNLKTLNLQDTQVTEAGLQQLRQALPGVTIAH